MVKKKEEAVTEEAVTEEAVTEEAQVTPTLTAGDLSTMVKVIDAGSQRGAWRGDELTIIGGLREKLVAIINTIAPAAAPDAPDAPDAAKETETETETESEPTEEVKTDAV